MSIDSKCLRYNKKKGLILENKNFDFIKNNQMLIKVKACGICGSDIKIIKHGNKRVKPGIIMGHEISGVVVTVGDEIKEFVVGDKVSIGADIPCNICDQCVSGLGKCESDLAYGHEIDGGFSEYLLMDLEHIENGPVQKFYNINYDLAALAEPLACCINGYEKVNFKNYNSVLVLGGGVIGMMLSYLGLIYNIPNIYIADISDERIQNFKKFRYLTDFFDIKSNRINDFKIDNGGFDLIFTSNNNPESQKQAIELIDNGGVVNFFGGLAKHQSYVEINTNKIHYKELIVTGSHGSSPNQHKKALEIIEKNSSFFEKLISKKISISDYKYAFEEATNPNNYKIIIEPNKF